jgi:hypothetical protein
MSDVEFDVLDELYFVISFNALAESTQLDPEKLEEVLAVLYAKGWLKVYKSASEELLAEGSLNFKRDQGEFFFLASKAGLLAHNGR